MMFLLCWKNFSLCLMKEISGTASWLRSIIKEDIRDGMKFFDHLVKISQKLLLMNSVNCALLCLIKFCLDTASILLVKPTIPDWLLAGFLYCFPSDISTEIPHPSLGQTTKLPSINVPSSCGKFSLSTE